MCAAVDVSAVHDSHQGQLIVAGPTQSDAGGGLCVCVFHETKTDVLLSYPTAWLAWQGATNLAGVLLFIVVCALVSPPSPPPATYGDLCAVVWSDDCALLAPAPPPKKNKNENGLPIVSLINSVEPRNGLPHRARLRTVAETPLSFL